MAYSFNILVLCVCVCVCVGYKEYVRHTLPTSGTYSVVSIEAEENVQ